MLTNGDLKLFEKGMPARIMIGRCFGTEVPAGIQSTLLLDIRE